jgi:antitoxin component YwqK of YwqJK toxin-antitoxin module
MAEVKRTYYDSGELCQEYFEVDGKKEGIYKSYHQSGNIEEIVPYINGLQNGEIKWYWENGKIETEFFMKNGKYHGEHKQYDENGELYEYRMYVDDIICYDCKDFTYRYGTTVSIAMYYDNKYPNGYKECRFDGISIEDVIKKNLIKLISFEVNDLS